MSGIITNPPLDDRGDTWRRRRELVLKSAAPASGGGQWRTQGVQTPPAMRRWAPHDFAWEFLQEQAAIAFRDGDAVQPSRLWPQALRIAQTHFHPSDPRLATSLTNQALLLRRRGAAAAGAEHLRLALAAWAASWRWVALMRPRDDGDDLYPEDERASFKGLVEEGRKATAALSSSSALIQDRVDDWMLMRPKGVNDFRKLLGAVFLIVPRPRIPTRVGTELESTRD